jgi:hypothetical protein
MQILLIYPSGTNVIEEVASLAHAEPYVNFGGDAFLVNEDGSRIPLAQAIEAAQIASEGDLQSETEEEPSA